MKVELVKHPNTEDWLLVKQCTLVTIGKDTHVPPKMDWMRRLLEAQHSPIRELKFVYRITDLPYWVAMHLVRHHVGCQPYIRTQRNDRQGEYDRNKAPQDSPVDMMWSLNAEALMTIAKKRLCRQASEETQAVVREMCRLAIEANPEFDGLLKPACAWQGGVCHEMFPCGKPVE